MLRWQFIIICGIDFTVFCAAAGAGIAMLYAVDVLAAALAGGGVSGAVAILVLLIIFTYNTPDWLHAEVMRPPTMAAKPPRLDDLS
jgi:hypothetical protein